MTEPSQLAIGTLIDVQGTTFLAELTLEDDALTVTIGTEDVQVGRISSYVLITQGDLGIVATVTRMTEQERLLAPSPPPPGDDALSLPYAHRVLQLTPLGTMAPDGSFQRGIQVYPTTGAQVFPLSSEQLNRLFQQFSDTGYDIGRHASTENLRVFLHPTPLFGRHLAILGQTGAGKSWAVANIVQKAVALMPKAHIVLLDLHGEYRWIDEDHQERFAFASQSVRYVDATQLEIPYWLLSFAELCDLLVDRSEFTAHNQVAFFRDKVLELKQREKDPLGLERITIDTPVFFPLDELVRTIAAKNEERVPGSSGRDKNGPLHGVFDRFLIRLDSRLADVRYDFLLKPRSRVNSNSLEPLLRDFVGLGSQKAPVTIIDLSTVPFDVRPTVTALIGRLAFEFNYWNPQYRDFPILLIAEEAHAYIPRSESSSFAGARASMERIAKEGRKYGVGLCVVSQRPRELSETVLAQCGTFLCLRMTNPDDQTYIRNVLPESERNLSGILASLGRGEALILGEGIPLPTRVQLDEPNPTPHSQDIDFYQKWLEGPDDIDVSEIVNRWRRQNRAPERRTD